VFVTCESERFWRYMQLAIPLVCSTGEKPRASGESFKVRMISNPTESAIIPGAHSPHFLRMKF
jgi:hypothetical protein